MIGLLSSSQKARLVVDHNISEPDPNGFNQLLLSSNSGKILPEINRTLPDNQHGNMANKTIQMTLTQCGQY